MRPRSPPARPPRPDALRRAAAQIRALLAGEGVLAFGPHGAGAAATTAAPAAAAGPPPYEVPVAAYNQWGSEDEFPFFVRGVINVGFRPANRSLEVKVRAQRRRASAPAQRTARPAARGPAGRLGPCALPGAARRGAAAPRRGALPTPQPPLRPPGPPPAAVVPYRT